MSQLQTSSIARFSCLGDACPDTCCQGWSMQLDAATLRKYETQAPELLDAVVKQDVPADSVLPQAIMRRDATTDVCVKFEAGWCGIHRAKGSDFLGDACHFYPRVLRRFDDAVSMTGTLSCPEMARLMLVEHADPFVREEMQLARLPQQLKPYAEGLSAADAFAVQDAFLHSIPDAGTPRQAMLMLHAMAQSLDGFPSEQWAEMVPMALKFAGSRILAAEPNPSDALNLLLALCGLMQAAGKSQHTRLRPQVERMAELLACELSWEPLGLNPTPETGVRLASLAMRVEMLPWLSSFLQRWLQAQLNVASFPFSGFGRTLSERGTIIGVRMATVLLAVLARAEAEGDGMQIEHAAEEAQILARFMDHLAEPEYSMQIYTETGWARLPRLRALLEGLGLR